MPNFVVYCFSDKVFLLQWHWGFKNVARNMINQGFKAFQMEVGMYGDIFAESYIEW